jgi:hypothetical protein
MWNLNKNEVRPPHEGLTDTEQSKLNNFIRYIQNDHLHPSEAALLAGDCDYKCIDTNYSIFQIRFSYKNRATFIVDDTNQMVIMREVGGHT